MTYQWFKVINRAEFLAADLVSKEVELLMEGIGLKTVMVTRGKLVSIIYEGVMLSLGMTSAMPFLFDSYGVYVDIDDDIFLGIGTT